MNNIFSKFFMSFGLSKDKYLPAGSNDIEGSANIANTMKPLASFDLNIEKPRYEGAIPDATIKFYPLD